MYRIPDHIKAVIFDLDGTLADSMYVWGLVDIDFLGRYNIPVPDDMKDDLEGMSFSETAEYFKKRFDLPLTVEEIKDCWNEMALYEYSHKVALKPGAAEFVPALKGAGYRLGIASSNSRTLVEAVLSAHGILEYFDAVTVACEVGKGKPAPDIYLCCAGLLGVEPGECLVFEDIPMGILSGRNAGMNVVAVHDEFSEYLDDKKRELSDAYIYSYDELVIGAGPDSF